MISAFLLLSSLPPVSCLVKIVTGKHVYYLKADSPNLLDEWLRVLLSVLRVKVASPLFTQPDIRPGMKGLLTKVQLPYTVFTLLFVHIFIYCTVTGNAAVSELCTGLMAGEAWLL